MSINPILEFNMNLAGKKELELIGWRQSERFSSNKPKENNNKLSHVTKQGQVHMSVYLGLLMSM